MLKVGEYILPAAAERMREAAKECRTSVERARQTMEEVAWQGKIAIEKAEWAERGTTGGGGGSKWREKWYNDKWYEGKDLYGEEQSVWKAFWTGADAGTASVLDAMTLHQVDAFHQAADQMWAKTSLGDTGAREWSEVSGYVAGGAGIAAVGVEAAAYLGISAIGTVGLSDLPNQVATELYTFGATGSPFAYGQLTRGSGAPAPASTGFQRMSAHIERATRRGARQSGVSIQEIYENPATGERFIRHTVADDAGRVVHQDTRSFYRPRAGE